MDHCAHRAEEAYKHSALDRDMLDDRAPTPCSIFAVRALRCCKLPVAEGQQEDTQRISLSARLRPSMPEHRPGGPSSTTRINHPQRPRTAQSPSHHPHSHLPTMSKKRKLAQGSVFSHIPADLRATLRAQAFGEPAPPSAPPPPASSSVGKQLQQEAQTGGTASAEVQGQS